MRTSPNRRIVVRFIVIVALTLLLNFGSYRFEIGQTKAIESGAAALKTAGHVGMQCYRVGLLSRRLVERTDPSDRWSSQDELAAQVALLQASHKTLIQADDTHPAVDFLVPSPAADALSVLDEEVRKFMTAANGLVEDETPSARSSDFRHIDEAIVSGSLLKAVDATAQAYQTQIEAGLARLQELRQWVLLGHAVLFLALALTVFVPLIGQVKRNIDKLQLLNLTLEQRMAAQKQAQQELTRQAQELARSNSELEQFASVASHDLQEPLRKIVAFGDRLQAKCGSEVSDEGKDYLQRMQSAARRMQTLINGLLTLSRVTSRAQPFAELDLANVVREVLADLEVRIEQASARVNVDTLPTIEADPMQMRQLMQNLIGNALKFSHPERPPVVKVYSRSVEAVVELQDGGGVNGDASQIIVEDNGVGFDPKHAERLFRVFERLHSRQEYEGTGVGLAICKKIAERHGGSIEATSEPMQGAKFMVTLPYRQVFGGPANDTDHNLVRG